MIVLTHLDGSKIAVNPSHILTIIEAPDTVVSLTNGETILVQDALEDVIEKAVHHARRCAAAPADRIAF